MAKPMPSVSRYPLASAKTVMVMVNPTAESAILDSDNDGLKDEQDSDNANACVPNPKAAKCDQDGDGQTNDADAG